MEGRPLMPKATAIWLVEHTALSFNQIAQFCQLHPLEVQAIADEELVGGMVGYDPVSSGQLTSEEIKRCENDLNAHLTLLKPADANSVLNKKKSRYTPVAKRQDRPDAIAWLLKYYPELTEQQICRLVGTTKQTIQAIRNKSHWNTANIKPRSPVHLGLCNQIELESLINYARRNITRLEENVSES